MPTQSTRPAPTSATPTKPGTYLGRLQSSDPFLPVKVIEDRDGLWSVGRAHVVNVELFEWAPRMASAPAVATCDYIGTCNSSRCPAHSGAADS